jgi:small subunit ribosomal protein S13
MVRIGNKEIPDNKNISTSLTYIFGIGSFRAKKITEDCNLDPNLKTKSLTDKQIKEISQWLGEYKVEGRLKEEIQKAISEQIRIGTYQGLRRSRKPNPLPIRGQRTRHNARTAKGHKRITVANKKKAPTPK